MNRTAIDELINEGQLYNTADDNHVQITVNKSAKFIPSLLTITLENKGQFPIPNITCILIFEKKYLEKQVIFEIECIESVSQEIMKPKSFTLNSQTQIIEKILLAPSELHQCEKRIHVGPKLFDEPLSYITVDLSPFILRKLWNIHPSIGLHDGLIFELIWTVIPSAVTQTQSGLSNVEMTIERNA
ncbi:6146_t:CDS:2 [Diversispora eburnea]|uniref:6146_t:CDS:1 n=1 Tax=Diversispora eburnea TaxID=1213867 RepID=A0A9N9FPJ5_9GLOM|nr:6146_t:CDS:2 [Diversispora eburnea]